MKRKQKLAASLMAAALAAVIAIPALAVSVMTIDVEPGVTVYVNDMPIAAGDTHGNPEAFIYNGTTYIAAAAVSKSLGENVKWEGSTRSVYIGKHEGSSSYLLNVCPPYQDRWMESLSTVTMAGKNYIHAIGFDTNEGYALFNLSGKYNMLSFDLGHRDEEIPNKGEVAIYLDDELVFAVEPDPQGLPKHYDIPLNGAIQMKITAKGEIPNGFNFALANVRVS